MDKKIYVDCGRATPSGYTLEELKALYLSGKISARALVIQEGDKEWTELRKSPFYPLIQGPKPEKTALVEHGEANSPIPACIDRIAERAFNLPAAPGEETTRTYQSTAKFLNLIGGYAILVSALMASFFSLILAARTNQFRAGLTGLVVVAVGITAHYIGIRFSSANLALLQSNRILLGSQVVPRTLAILLLITAITGGMVRLLYGCAQMTMEFSGGFFIILTAAYAMAGLLAASWFLAHPSEILYTESTRDTSIHTGEYAISLFKLFARTLLALNPVLFGLGSALACLCIPVDGVTLLNSVKQPTEFSDINIPLALEHLATTTPLVAVILVGFLPLLIHLLYLGLVLSADLAEAIFRIADNTTPRK
jgi:hypothetical protein